MSKMDQKDFHSGMSPQSSGRSSMPGLATIIRVEIERSGKGVRELTRSGVITERTRRNFYERLEAGLLSTTEVMAIQEYLGIDPIRLMCALLILRDPMTYFDPFCETVAAVAQEFGPALQEQVEAIRGDFTPIHRNLCKAQASKLAKEIANHSERARHYREKGFDWASTTS